MAHGKNCRSEMRFTVSKVKKRPPLQSFSSSLETDSSEEISQSMGDSRLPTNRQNTRLVSPERIDNQFVSALDVPLNKHKTLVPEVSPSGHKNELSSQERKNTGRTNRLPTSQDTSQGKALKKLNTKRVHKKRMFVSQYSTTLKTSRGVSESFEAEMTHAMLKSEESGPATVRDLQGRSTGEISSSPNILVDFAIDKCSRRENLSLDSGLGSMVDALSPRKGEKDEYSNVEEDDDVEKQAVEMKYEENKTVLHDSDRISIASNFTDILENGGEKYKESQRNTTKPLPLQLENSQIASRRQKRKSQSSFASKLGSIPEKFQPFSSNRCLNQVYVQLRRKYPSIRCVKVPEVKKNPALLEASLKPINKKCSLEEGSESIHVCKTWAQFPQGFSYFSIYVTAHIEAPVKKASDKISNENDEVAISEASVEIMRQTASQQMSLCSEKNSKETGKECPSGVGTPQACNKKSSVIVQHSGVWKSCAVLVGAISYET